MMTRSSSHGRVPGGHHARTSGVVTVLLAVVLSLATGTGPAAAYWTSTGSGSALAQTGTLGAPEDVTVPESASAEVPVGWMQGALGAAVEGYYVTRHTAAGVDTPATSAAACSSSPSALLQLTSCTDAGVPDGDYTYVVTAVHQSWTAPSSPSGSVTVVNATQVAFLTQPTTVTTDEAISPAVRVALRTVDDQPADTAGVPVTLVLGVNLPGGTLAGNTTADTDAEGVATFPGLSIDRAGFGYTLVATSPGLNSATSDPFTVDAPPVLGAAGGYSLLAWTAVVSSGASTISGDVGVSPGTTVTGLDAGSVGGDLHVNDADAALAQEALGQAFTELAGRPADAEVVGNLGGRTLTPGVYHSTAALALTGTLILDAEDDPGAVFVFQTDAAFDTAAASRVTLVNGAQAANVFWVVTGAAGTGASSFISGNVLSQGAISLGAGTVLIGRALSRDAVTLAATTVRFTDMLPPTITIAGGATDVSGATPTIAGTSTASTGSSVRVTIGGQTLETTTGTDDSWSVTAAALPAGVYEVVARVRAPSGDAATDTQTLTVEVNPAPVILGAADTYSVLASTAVVATGTTHLSGDLGVSPSDVVTGFGPAEGGTLEGTIHAGDAEAAQARADLVVALADASSRAAHTEIIGDLGGRTFHVGVHHSTAALALTGGVTLDAQGDPDAVFIFETDAAFDTAAGSTVSLVGGAQASRVFWVVAGAAGTGADTVLAGSILARGATTLGAGTRLEGRALSLENVTLASNTLTGVTPADQPAVARASGSVNAP